MDPPYIHHNSRYAPFSSPPQNPNLYRPPPLPSIYHQHQQLSYLPTPPPPPPPHPQPLQHHHPPARLPTPLPPSELQKAAYSSHNSPQFAYNPNFSPNPNLKPPPHNQYHHERSDHFSRRIPIEDDRRLHHPHHLRQRVLTHFDARANRLDHPPRNLPDHRLVVNTLDRLQHQFDHGPMSPFRSVDKIKHELDTSSYRFRERERYNNNIDGFEFEYRSSGSSSSKSEFVSHRSHFVSDSDRLNSSNYNNQHGSQFDSDELVRNNVRDGVFDRQALREREVHDSLTERGSNSENGTDEVRVISGKRDLYALDSGRYVNNRGSRENSYEYNWAPRKQVQKKSALLRIQRPHYKNRDDGELHYSGYEVKSGSFRGKDQVVFLDPQGDEEGEEEREGSPVELDVSFKSNSLVAKAIVAPSSSAIVADTNLRPKNGNVRKYMVSDKDCSSSKMNKPPDSVIKLDGSRDAMNNASGSDFRDSKQSKWEVAPSTITRSDNSLQFCSSGSNISPAKITVGKSKGIVSNKWGPGVGTSKISSVKVAKKRRVVKKAVKKPINSNVNVSISQPAKKIDEPLKADGSTADPPAAPVTKMGLKLSKETITTAMASDHPVDMHPYPDGANILPGNDKVGRSPLAAMISKEGSTGDDSHVSSATKIKRSGSISPLLSSSHEETKIDEVSVNADNSLHVIHTVSSTDKDLTKSLNENTVSDVGTVVEGDGKKFCQNRPSLLLENSATKETPKILTSAGRSINPEFLSLEDNKGHESLVSTCNIVHTTTNFNNGLVNSSQEKMNNPDAGNMNTPTEQLCKRQMSPSVNSSTVEGYPLFILPGARCEVSSLLSSEEVGIHNVSTHADCFDNDKCSVAFSNINSEEMIVVTGDYNGKLLAQNEVNTSLENDVTKGFPNTLFSVGSREGDIPNTANKSKIMTSLSDLPDAMIIDMFKGPVKAVSSEQCADTILSLSVKDFSSAEDRVSGSLDGSLQSCSDALRDLLGDNSTGGCCEANVSDSSRLIRTSPEKRKGRKVSACHTGFTGVIVSEISEGPVTPASSTSGAELPSNSNEGLIQPRERVAASNMDILHDSDLPPCPDGIAVLSEKSLAQVSSGVAVSVGRDASRVGDDGLKVEHPRNDSCSAFGKSDIANAPSCPGSESKQRANENTVMNESNYKNDLICSKSEKTEAVAAEEQVKACSEATQFKTPSEHQSWDLNQILPAMEVESNGCFLEKGHLPSASTYPALAADGDGVSTTNSNDEMMEIDSLTDMGSLEILSSVPVMCTLIHEASSGQISNEKVCGIDKISNEKPVDEGIFSLSAHTSHSEDAKVNLKSDNVPIAQLAAGRTVLLPSQDVKGTGNNLNPTSGEMHGKNPLSHAVSRSQPSCSSLFSASRNAASSTRIRKPRTWHRTETSSAFTMPINKSLLCAVSPQNQLPMQAAKSQGTSYIRKGNSLVRKSAPVAALPQVSHGLNSSVYRLTSSGISKSKKTTGSNSSADVIEAPNVLKMGGVNAPFQRPRTPPLPIVTKVPNQATNSRGVCTSSPLAEPLPDGCSETTSDPQRFSEINDEQNSSLAALKISETPLKQTGVVNASENQSELNDGTLATSNMKRITYVKRKSNQLVAASNDCGLSVQNPDKTQGFTSDGYYKRRKNQLIRTSLENRISQTVTSIDGFLTSEGQKAPKDILSRSYSKRQSYKVLKKIRKPLRFSLVWTLNSMQSSKIDDHSLYCQKVLPYLIPWKSAAYWRRFVQDSISISNNSSLSAISRKLLMLSKRDTVYTRSSHGFSLQKSKVLSVGGSSLKWSKSIENRSKKANEEATLAVAAVEKKKKQQSGAESFASKTKSKSHFSRNRIFRIGSVRYKMDASRRTLQRLSDDESSCSAAPNSEKNAKKSYIPRRLVIGNDEYVRIGNGNQLIRDPKKRARVLASEKVRWSLHTARLRLARKRKYCQFFTRFGKCNKDDGKCPYIHDPSKIAVCTKFLNGLCSNSNCKLTHKVIPERMPDCSYFLQGLCTNKNCPYRHVHVKPNASSCEAFLKGYCADGNECRKKHSYVCPTFEATGSCPEGSKCKLHHPKSRSKGRKSRRSRKQKSTHGRYFGSMLVDDSDPLLTISERHSIQDNGKLFIEGKLADFISLDVSDGEAGQNNDALNEQTTFHDSDDPDSQLDDLDELIKPLRIMNCQRWVSSPQPSVAPKFGDVAQAFLAVG